MVIYTSGTTGRPKGAVHVHAGFPIKAAQDMAHCFDVQADDRVWWYTDLGWMMGPWLISGALLLGATVFLYDGAPDWPAPDRLWDTAGAAADYDPRLGPDWRARPDARRPPPDRRDMISPAYVPSRRRVSHGTRSRGGGTSDRSAGDAARSSTTPAVPKSPAASSPRRPSSHSSRAPLPGRCPEWPPTW